VQVAAQQRAQRLPTLGQPGRPLLAQLQQVRRDRAAHRLGRDLRRHLAQVRQLGERAGTRTLLDLGRVQPLQRPRRLPERTHPVRGCLDPLEQVGDVLQRRDRVHAGILLHRAAGPAAG
jgi:hypothetical protein